MQHLVIKLVCAICLSILAGCASNSASNPPTKKVYIGDYKGFQVDRDINKLQLRRGRADIEPYILTYMIRLEENGYWKMVDYDPNLLKQQNTEALVVDAKNKVIWVDFTKHIRTHSCNGDLAYTPRSKSYNICNSNLSSMNIASEDKLFGAIPVVVASSTQNNVHLILSEVLTAAVESGVIDDANQKRGEIQMAELKKEQERAKEQARQKRLAEENQKKTVENWLALSHQAKAIGDKVCTYDNQLGFVDRIAQNKVKVLVVGRLGSFKSDGFFFDELRRDKSFWFDKINEYRWFESNEVGACSFNY